jgi:hypothetical protein
VDNNPLGNGDSLTPSTLSVGNHVITLAATNAEGVTGTNSIHLSILPPDPKSQSVAEMSFFFRLLLWAIFPAGILLVVGIILLVRKSRRKAV